MSKTIDWNDFIKVDMRVGKIVDVRDFPEARKPAYILTVDFGPLGVRKTSAQITNYTKEALLSRDVVAVFNFPPKQIGSLMTVNVDHSYQRAYMLRTKVEHSNYITTQ